MKKTFKLEGLGCANCAAKMEREIGKINGVNSVTVNFITTKLVIEAEDDKMSYIIEAAKTIINKIEPNVVMKKS
ncbi:MAG: cation transport ATPase [Clostridia bacterium]|jgi:copper chaperone CopZ|nr:cation transport ATPase [Clostridia bacterium]